MVNDAIDTEKNWSLQTNLEPGAYLVGFNITMFYHVLPCFTPPPCTNIPGSWSGEAKNVHALAATPDFFPQQIDGNRA